MAKNFQTKNYKIKTSPKISLSLFYVAHLLLGIIKINSLFNMYTSLQLPFIRKFVVGVQHDSTCICLHFMVENCKIKIKQQCLTYPCLDYLGLKVK